VRRFTVRQLTQELTQLITDRYPSLEVEGEVSQLAVPGSGHAYITLAEGDTILNAVMWKNAWSAVSWTPKRGDRVVCRGKMGAYAGKGAWQLYIHTLQRAGEGELAAEIARRKARLAADGLLDPRRKRPLPRMPRVVGVATSLTGAALQDFLKVSRERFPAAQIRVAACLVQGSAAPASVVAAVELLLEDGLSEVIVVTRGGGSKEDLLAFQDEGLARFLAHSPVPVVSAVGHQVDTTLCDGVADVVAPTPTAAAVVALPDGPALAQRVDERTLALVAAMSRRVDAARSRVAGAVARLRHPGDRLRDIRRRAQEASSRLVRLLGDGLQRRRLRLAPLEQRLIASLRARLPRGRDRVEALEVRLQRAARHLVAQRRARLASLEQAAVALSPQAVLDRGYAVVVGPRGVVTDPDQVMAGDALRLQVARGEIRASVRAEPEPSAPRRGGGT
jgi:exodeoxyribonuclease VII large subunit